LRRTYRQTYVKKYFYKEMDFIATYYKNKNSKSGKQVYERIMGLSETMIRSMIAVYIALKS
jgi:hypothetical protein